jgi:filamentous hemagglutinin
VDWRRVEEIHTSFKYSHSGLGPAAQVILAIALAVVTGGAGLGAGLVGASAGTFTAGFANTVLAAVMNNAANSMISNKGNLSSTFKDITSKDAMKGYVVSGLMGGIAGTLGYDPTKLGLDWNSAGQVVLKTGADTLVQTAINGGSLGDNFANNLLGAVINIAGAVAANQIGEINRVDGSPTKIAAHALLGGLKSMAMGGDFQTGALAGGANEAMVQYLAGLVLPGNYNPNLPGNQQAQVNLMAMSQLLGVLAAVVTGGDPEIAANIAANATQYNYLSHSDLERASKELLGCGNDTKCAEDAYTKYHDLSAEQTAQAYVACANDKNACARISTLVNEAEVASAKFKDMAATAPPAVANMLNMLIAENYGFQNDLAGVTSGTVAELLATKLGLSPERAAELVVAVRLGVAAFNAAKSGGGAKGIQKVPGLGEVDDFFASQSTNLNKKLGAKIGEGRLPYEASRTGVDQAKATVKETLENATSVSPVIPSSTVRGNYDLVHVYSSKTNSTVSLRVLPDGKYEFDTLIPEKSSKF